MERCTKKRARVAPTQPSLFPDLSSIQDQSSHLEDPNLHGLANLMILQIFKLLGVTDTYDLKMRKILHIDIKSLEILYKIIRLENNTNNDFISYKEIMTYLNDNAVDATKESTEHEDVGRHHK